MNHPRIVLSIVLALQLFSCTALKPGEYSKPSVPAPSIKAEKTPLHETEKPNISKAEEKSFDLQEAIDAYYKGLYEQSLSILDTIIRHSSTDMRTRKELAALYKEAGNYDGAIRLLEEICFLSPEDTELKKDLFITCCLAGYKEQAQSLFSKVLDDAEILFYKAVLSMDSGDTNAAKTFFIKSLEWEPWQPMAHYFLGMLAVNENKPSEAEAYFTTALKQEPNLTTALYPLAQCKLALNKTQEAYGFLLRARNILPSHAGIQELIHSIENQHPEYVEKRAESAKKRKDATIPPEVVSISMEIAASMPLVRIGLAERLSSVSLKTGGNFTLRSETSEPSSRYKGNKGELLTIKTSTDGMTVSDRNENIILASKDPIILIYEKPEYTTVIFDFISESGSFYAVDEDRIYRGSLKFLPRQEGITLINTLNIEEYLYSVVPSEMPPSWPQAALRAQAIAARSYTLASLGSFSQRGFDVFGSVASASYRGIKNETKTVIEAVDATRGKILTVDGVTLKAFYSANSGGYTEDSISVWGSDAHMQAVADKHLSSRETFMPLHDLVAWLKSKPFSYSSYAPYYSKSAYRWEQWVSAEEIAARIRTEKNIGTILSLITRGRGRSGRVEEVQVVGSDGEVRVRSDKIRSRLGSLRSTLFTVTPKLGPSGLPEYFIFTGAGWGHGVGMCQSGAAGMAASGFDTEAILAHYYPKAVVSEYVLKR